MLRKTSVAAAFIASLAISRADIGVEQVAKGFDRPLWAGVPKEVKGNSG